MPAAQMRVLREALASLEATGRLAQLTDFGARARTPRRAAGVAGLDVATNTVGVPDVSSALVDPVAHGPPAAPLVPKAVLARRLSDSIFVAHDHSRASLAHRAEAPADTADRAGRIYGRFSYLSCCDITSRNQAFASSCATAKLVS